MEKLADISSFESIGSSVVPVFNFGTWVTRYEDRGDVRGEYIERGAIESFADLELECQNSPLWNKVREYMPVDDLSKREQEFFKAMEKENDKWDETPIEVIFEYAMKDGLLVELGWMDEDDFDPRFPDDDDD